jgi:AraC-like DNA-binding protein
MTSPGGSRMPSEPANFAPLRLSTSGLPERRRIPVWREEVGRTLLRIDIVPPAGSPFRATATMRALPGLRVTSFVSSGARFERTRALVADGNDDFGLVMHLSGTSTASQRGLDVALGGGDAIPIASGEPGALIHSDSRFIGLAVPWAALSSLAAHIEDKVMRRIPGDTEALRLLRRYLAALEDDCTLNAPELRHLAVTHVHDLVALAVGAAGDAADVAEARGLRAARLMAIKADIAEHLGRRDLTLLAVATRQNVSPRYVQKLFEREGLTFSEFVLDQRLARAHRLLSDPRCADRTVSAIAFAAGFGDLSYFNRVFRARYGATPSDVRPGAQRA